MSKKYKDKNTYAPHDKEIRFKKALNVKVLYKDISVITGYDDEILLKDNKAKGISAANLYKSGCSPAFDTKMRAFLINIFNVGTRSHHAGWVSAVQQSKVMTQFMDHFFFKTIYE
jgi:hypothetical protein